MNNMKDLKAVKIGGFILWILWLIFCIGIGLGSILSPESTFYNFMLKFLSVVLIFNVLFTVIYIELVFKAIKPFLTKNNNEKGM